MKIIRDNEHKKLGSKPGKNPTRGKPKNNPLLIETNQSKISTTQGQDQDCHKDSIQPSSKPSPISHSQQNSTPAKSLSFGQSLKSRALKFWPCNNLKKPQNKLACGNIIREKINSSSLSFDLIFSPSLSFDFASFSSFLGTKISVYVEWSNEVELPCTYTCLGGQIIPF